MIHLIVFVLGLLDVCVLIEGDDDYLAEQYAAAEALTKAFVAIDMAVRLRHSLRRLPCGAGNYVAIYGIGEHDNVRYRHDRCHSRISE